MTWEKRTGHFSVLISLSLAERGAVWAANAGRSRFFCTADARIISCSVQSLAQGLCVSVEAAVSAADGNFAKQPTRLPLQEVNPRWREPQACVLRSIASETLAPRLSPRAAS